MSIKIIDLQAENAPSDDDLLIIRDNASGITRKITRAVLFTSPPLAAGSITNTMIADGSISKSKFAADAKIIVKTYSAASPTSLTPNADSYDVFAVTNLNSDMSVANPTGTPVDGQGIMFRIKDNGTAHNISWGNKFRTIGITIPTNTIAGKMTYVAARWNDPAQLWDVISVGRE